MRDHRALEMHDAHHFEHHRKGCFWGGIGAVLGEWILRVGPEHMHVAVAGARWHF